MYNRVMRSLSVLLVGSVMWLSGCTDRPEVLPDAYGIILEELPTPDVAEAPFPFPREGDNDHQNCVFNEDDFF